VLDKKKAKKTKTKQKQNKNKNTKKNVNVYYNSLRTNFFVIIDRITKRMSITDHWK